MSTLVDNIEINSFEEVNNKLKDILSLELGDKFIFDKDVAKALNINQKTFSTMKARNKIPYKDIFLFLAHKKISINYIFFNQILKLNKKAIS